MRTTAGRALALHLLLLSLGALTCTPINAPDVPVAESTERLSVEEIQSVLAHAVEQANRQGASIVAAVIDRYGAVLAVFRMTGSGGVPQAAVAKARTAAYLSSDQHGFTSLTACFITRGHFPPGVSNLPGGPLFGVGFSSLAGGDIQPRGGGLSDRPGGVPLFENGDLVGALGIDGGDDAFDAKTCGGSTVDELIALGAADELTVRDDERGDNIFLNGVRLLYANVAMPRRDYTMVFSDVFPSMGSLDQPIVASPPVAFIPFQGEVVLTGYETTHDFSIHAGSLLSESDVRRIITQAIAQANRTRAAIRRPLGSPARVFITVADVDGSILGIWRTPDATVFSFDVSAQKARTAIAFSDPSQPLGARVRALLDLDPAAPFAITTRAIGFLSQDFFPPGIDEERLGRPVMEGPFFGLQADLGLDPFGNGITIFPGGIPLYRNGQLVGGVGVSGDGVDQDDIVASAGSEGFEPPFGIRSDQFFYDGVRLPWVKFPRQPELD